MSNAIHVGIPAKTIHIDDAVFNKDDPQLKEVCKQQKMRKKKEKKK